MKQYIYKINALLVLILLFGCDSIEDIQDVPLENITDKDIAVEEKLPGLEIRLSPFDYEMTEDSKYNYILNLQYDITTESDRDYLVEYIDCYLYDYSSGEELTAPARVEGLFEAKWKHNVANRIIEFRSDKKIDKMKIKLVMKVEGTMMEAERIQG